jgi:hypothetical protein
LVCPFTKINAVNILQRSLSHVCFNIISLFATKPPQWPSSFRFPLQSPIYISFLPHVPRAQLHFITLKTFGQQYQPWRSSLHSFLELRVTSSILSSTFPSASCYVPIFHTTHCYVPIFHTTHCYVPIFHTTHCYVPVFHTTPCYVPIFHTTPRYVPIFHTQPRYVPIIPSFRHTQQLSIYVQLPTIVKKKLYFQVQTTHSNGNVANPACRLFCWRRNLIYKTISEFASFHSGGGGTSGTRRIADRASILLVFLFTFHFVLVQTYYLLMYLLRLHHVPSESHILATQLALSYNQHTCLNILHTQPNASLVIAISPQNIWLAQSTYYLTSVNKLPHSTFSTVFKFEHLVSLQYPKTRNASVSRISAIRASTMLLWSNAAN